MPSVPRVGDLDIDQDLRFQRREWVFERLAWIAMALFIGAALLGLLGDGPLSDRTAASPDGAVEVDYQRVIHYRSATTLTVRVTGPVTAAGTFRLGINREFLDNVQVLQVTPEPERTEAGDTRHVFVFRTAEPGRPTTVIIHLEPNVRGRLRAGVTVGDGPPAAFDQTVLP
jgi:hypothetical protein